MVQSHGIRENSKILGFVYWVSGMDVLRCQSGSKPGMMISDEAQTGCLYSQIDHCATSHAVILHSCRVSSILAVYSASIFSDSARSDNLIDFGRRHG